MLTFRRAQRDDVRAIVALLADDPLGRSRESATPELEPGYLHAFEAIDRDANQLLLVADDDGVVVGCLQLTFIPGLSRRGMWRGLLEGVRVASTRRNVGLGSAMVRHAIELCRQRGCGLLELASDKSRTDAQRFYKSLGFIASHEGMKLSLK